MVLHHGQNVFQITERTQAIRLCGFRNSVDDRTGFCVIDTVAQLPCMFVQADVCGKVILQPHGKEFFTWYSKHLFTLHGKHFFT